ncbi:MAG: hypothetical protein QNK19_09890 [Xanthomonadales bacterium]|nr:hypothetical protein [Xanthomonadales bacterium]
MYDAVSDSIAVINNRQPTTINMVGWSRGSITSLMIAQQLRSTRISVNMFLFDPVVGDPVVNAILHRYAPINSIGRHVKALSVVQMMDATSFLFQAHGQFSGRTNRAGTTSIYQMPGLHGSAVYQSDPRYGSAYTIGKGLVQDFLHSKGTPLESYHALTTREYLENYSNLWLKVSGGLGYVPEDSPLSNRAEATRFANGMVVRVTFNQHHISVLNAHAPRSALALMYALTSRSRPHPNVLAAADRERQNLPSSMPKTKRYLEQTRGWLRIYN